MHQGTQFMYYPWINSNSQLPPKQFPSYDNEIYCKSGIHGFVLKDNTYNSPTHIITNNHI